MENGNKKKDTGGKQKYRDKKAEHVLRFLVLDSKTP